jgi:dTDP-glucose pyrophosphorylase
MRNEYEITDAIQIFIDDGYRVESAEVVKEDVNVSFPADLLELNLRMLERANEPNWFGASVEVEPGALLERTVVMDGASVAAGSALTECLRFPGAKVPSGKVAHRTNFTSESEIRCAGGELS